MDELIAKLPILINFSYYIYIGVLRDTSSETPLSPTYNLSASQHAAYQHVSLLLSTMEPISNEFLEEEQEIDFEHTIVSKFACQSCPYLQFYK